MPNDQHRRVIWAAGAAGLMLSVSAIASGQSQRALYHQSWSTDAGLPQSSVHQILQSRDGYLWLATEGGAVRYDGVTFRVFDHETEPSFTSDDVSSLAEDRAGDVWFGTADGLIEDLHGHIIRFGEAEGLPSPSVLSLRVGADGAIDATTTAGVVRFDGSRFEPLPETLENGDQGFHGVAKAPNGVSWSWSKDSVIAGTAVGNSMWRVGRDLPGARVQAVLIDRDGEAWVGTNRGLVTVNAATGVARTVAELGFNSVLAILQDAEGNLWIGTETSGLHALRQRKFRGVPELADDEVTCVVQASDGAMWIGTREDGLRRVAGKDAVGPVQRPVPNAALTSPVILSLAPGLRGDVWAGTPDGLNHVEANGKTTRYTSSDGLPDDLVRSLLMAGDGTLWVGTRRGLARFRGGAFATLTQADGLGSDLIGALYEERGLGTAGRGDVWAGTLAGMSRVHDGSIANYGRAEGLTTVLVTGVVSDREGRLWVSSRDAGLFLFDGHRFTAIGAVPRELEGVIADAQGFLWIRGRRGVVRASADELAACRGRSDCRPALAKYGAQDGMPDEDVVVNVSPSAWLTKEGEVWFATRKGVAITDPAHLPVNAVAPPVVVERFLVDDDSVPSAEGDATIASGHERYTFDFAGMSFTVPAKVLYRYKLEGFDRDWSTASARRTATYTNLPAGRYIFRVQAANNDGVWNESGAAVRFRILSPIYRRWWFLLLAVCALGGLVLALYRLRMRRVRRNFGALLAERNRIAREIHDTLAQDFVGVSLQLDLVSQMLAREKVDEASAQVKATREFVQTGLEEARQSIWNLRANTAQGSLPTRVGDLVKRFSMNGLVVKTKMGGAYRPLEAAVEDEVMRILQEALLNVERHAGAESAHVHLTYGEDTLVMGVDDDGRGFSLAEAANKNGHFGLQGMRERAATIGAELDVRTTIDEGTALRLVVPIAERKGWKG